MRFGDEMPVAAFQFVVYWMTAEAGKESDPSESTTILGEPNRGTLLNMVRQEGGQINNPKVKCSTLVQPHPVFFLTSENQCFSSEEV